MRTAAAAALLALALAGCAQVDTQRLADPPTLDIDRHHRFGAAAPGAPAASEADLFWWRRFDDPELGRWVERALQQHPEPAIAEERVAQARALLVAVRAQRGLQVATESSVSLRLAGAEGGRRVQQSAVVSLDYDLDLWGGLRAQQASAVAEVLRVQALAQAARLSVAGTAARAYLEWRLALQDHALLLDTIAVQRDALRIVDVRVEAGLNPVLDRDRATAEVAALEAEQAAAAARAGQASAALQVVAGQRPQLELTVPAAAAAAGAAPPRRVPDPQPGQAQEGGAGEAAMARAGPRPPTAEGAPVTRPVLQLPALAGAAPVVRPLELLRLRPDLRAAEHALLAAAADIGVAEAALLPGLRLPGTLVFGAAGLGALELVSATVAAAVQATLFDGGARRADLQAAVSRAREASLVYRQALLEALRQVEAALLAQQGARARITARERALAAARAAASQADTLYRVGLVGFLDVADAQRAVLANARALLQARADAALADVTAFEAMGLIAPDGVAAP